MSRNEQLAAIAALLAEGRDTASIAAAVGCTTYAVCAVHERLRHRQRKLNRMSPERMALRREKRRAYFREYDKKRRETRREAAAARYRADRTYREKKLAAVRRWRKRRAAAAGASASP